MGKLVQYDIHTVESDALRYLNARPFIDVLKRYEKCLDRQQFKTLRGQALAGDVDGAEKGLARLLNRRR